MPDPHATVRDGLEERARAVRKQHAAMVRRERRERGGKTLAIVGLAGMVGWLAWTNGQLAHKASTRDTVYAVLQPNGEWITSTHYDEVTPAAHREEDIQNALWTYVQARDCYNTPGFVRQAYIAQAMSDARVGRQVHQQFSPANPNAPQHVYGEHGTTVQCELVDPPTPIGTDGDTYLFRFRRWEQDARGGGDASAAPFYSVSVRYRSGIYPTDDKRRAWLDRTTFNAAGVQVLDYPGATPDNARLPRRPGATAEPRT